MGTRSALTAGTLVVVVYLPGKSRCQFASGLVSAVHMPYDLCTGIIPFTSIYRAGNGGGGGGGSSSAVLDYSNYTGD